MVVLPLSLCSPPVMAPCLSRGPTQDVSEYILCYYSPTSSPWGGKGNSADFPCFNSCKPTAILLSQTLKPRSLLHPGQSPCPWRGFSGCGKPTQFPPPQFPLWGTSPVPIPIFFLSYLIFWRFSCPFGSLRSSSSIQWMFCVNSSTCRCIIMIL